ncbi:MAG: hypothetical protein OD918_08060 [Gammaproteobacteria bacterium]
MTATHVIKRYCGIAGRNAGGLEGHFLFCLGGALPLRNPDFFLWFLAGAFFKGGFFCLVMMPISKE